MFADLGAFSRRAIQLSWSVLAYPCLLMAYIGQAAYISVDARGAAYTNPFFNTVPHGRVLLCHGHLGLDDHCGVAGHDHVQLSVADPGHAVVVLSAYQDGAYEQQIPRAGVHAVGELAVDDWSRGGYSGV